MTIDSNHLILNSDLGHFEMTRSFRKSFANDPDDPNNPGHF
ncbi:5055_t:CDS:2 [Cetraspora pellucida]|uniref:5055_t:CDS:1 n=1 Tax=Cetraspora pellucida TaxID=1433469 RepID=A0ACA9K3A8_9GLOM|nr:5055_t:CDS:2 [Cetraspora pellucida]